MSKRVCPVPGCPAITNGGPCPTHLAAKRRRRGTTTQRGYGAQHQRQRVHLIANALGTPCPDCGQVMTDPTEMVADHSQPLVSTDRTGIADRVHCRPCSDRQGGCLARGAT